MQLNTNILIIEDEPLMVMGLTDNLKFEGYGVTSASDGKEGLEKILNNHYDLIILDIMMPELSGLEVCKTVRQQGIRTPIIFLTAKGEEIDKILGLELGADDYITKPFSIRELTARIKAVLRRTNTGPPLSQKITIGQLMVDFTCFEAKKKSGAPVRMTIKEFEVLQYLYSHKNNTVSRYQLLEDVWGYESQPTTRTIDNFILKLRQKIEDNPSEPKHIFTIYGVGYRLVE